jgi:hypothetical protein
MRDVREVVTTRVTLASRLGYPPILHLEDDCIGLTVRRGKFKKAVKVVSSGASTHV